MAGGFYAYTALFPDPAQVISDVDGETKLQLGDELDSDYGYFDDVLPGFDLDTSTSPAHQITVPAGEMTELTAEIFLIPTGSVQVRIGYVVVDDGGVVVSDEVTGTFTTSNSSPAAEWAVGPFTVGTNGRAYLFAEVLTEGGETTIADNGYLQFTYELPVVAGNWSVGRVRWPR